MSEQRKERRPFNWGRLYADIEASRERAKERKREERADETTALTEGADTDERRRALRRARTQDRATD
jgi:hypothetical protein